MQPTEHKGKPQPAGLEVCSPLHIVTSEEMRRLDRLTIDGIGIPALVLMENAGRAIAEAILRLLREKLGRDRAAWSRERWLVLAGKGNNGGDGLAAARHLLEAGVAVEAALTTAADSLTGEARQQAAMAARFGVPCFDASEAGAPVPWHRYSGIIDALLGTGTAGAPREPAAALIRAANASRLPIVAADIPSGLDADTGAVHEPCIRADRTVALAFLKRGLTQYPGAEAAGSVTVAPIGIPSRLADEAGIRVRAVAPDTVADALGLDPERPRAADSHKGTFGHVLAAAGSPRMLGAGMLCTSAALRAGCGLATWAMPESAAALAAGRVPEAMLAPVAESAQADVSVPADRGGLPGPAALPPTPPAAPPQAANPWSRTSGADLAALSAGRDATVAGPGLGRWPGDTEWLRAVWEGVTGPLVLDADALNMLADAQGLALWPRRTAPTVLTPHPGEMARLARTTTAGVQQDRIGLALRFAEQHGVVLVLKGARTVTAGPDGAAYVNATGGPAMATGGSGDVLAGIIASLLAQGYPAEQAAAFGVYLHGAAGDRAAARRPAGGASLIAGDLLAEL
ncbi:NAD(P)H-hydrate dehydratase [Gorillibacterium sp. sgz5001074]|uniref:NAD(P)H-hydrate dehydratase n=1 Tax=Gorillibacterium sp. sgz5001074 TaxID=3446695 RepID=UPI003F6687AD